MLTHSHGIVETRNRWALGRESVERSDSAFGSFEFPPEQALVFSIVVTSTRVAKLCVVVAFRTDRSMNTRERKALARSRHARDRDASLQLDSRGNFSGVIATSLSLELP